MFGLKNEVVDPLSKGNGLINNVISQFQSMVDDLTEGQDLLKGRKDENNKFISDLEQENAEINNTIETAEKFKDFLNKARGKDKDEDN
jgi:uncharacterized membrane-anchored protein YhcB (DUF1043 family)